MTPVHAKYGVGGNCPKELFKTDPTSPSWPLPQSRSYPESTRLLMAQGRILYSTYLQLINSLPAVCLQILKVPNVLNILSYI